MLFYPLKEFTIIPIIELSNISIFLLFIILTYVIFTLKDIIIFNWSIWDIIKEWWYHKKYPNGIRRIPVKEEPSSDESVKETDSKKET